MTARKTGIHGSAAPLNSQLQQQASADMTDGQHMQRSYQQPERVRICKFRALTFTRVCRVLKKARNDPPAFLMYAVQTRCERAGVHCGYVKGPTWVAVEIHVGPKEDVSCPQLEATLSLPPPQPFFICSYSGPLTDLSPSVSAKAPLSQPSFPPPHTTP